VRRNGGIIGPNREPRPESTNGIYDLYDQYNSVLYDLWTRSAGYSSITYDRGAQVFEGDTLVFNVTTVGVANGSRVYWFLFNINGVDSSDIVGGTTSGNFTITNNLGSFTITLATDTTPEPNQQFRIQLREQNNVNAAVVLQTGVIQILEPGATLQGPSSMNEGTTANIQVTTTDFPSGSLNWDIDWGTGTRTNTDLDAFDGSVIISNSSGTITVGANADGYTESTPETFRVLLRNTAGTVIGASNYITINDTSTGGSEIAGNLAVKVLWLANDWRFPGVANLKTLNDSLANSEPQYYSTASTFTAIQEYIDLASIRDHTPYDVVIWSNNYRGGNNTFDTILGFLNNNKGFIMCNFAHTYWNAQNAYNRFGVQWQITNQGGWTNASPVGTVAGTLPIMRGVNDQRDQGFVSTGFTPVNGGAYADETNTSSTRMAIYKDFGIASRRVDINAYIGGAWDDSGSVSNGILRCLLNSCYWVAKRQGYT